MQTFGIALFVPPELEVKYYFWRTTHSPTSFLVKVPRANLRGKTVYSIHGDLKTESAQVGDQKLIPVSQPTQKPTQNWSKVSIQDMQLWSCCQEHGKCLMLASEWLSGGYMGTPYDSIIESGILKRTPTVQEIKKWKLQKLLHSKNVIRTMKRLIPRKKSFASYSSEERLLSRYKKN